MNESPKKKRLGNLRFRDTKRVAAQSASYSLIVHRLRWILPIFALLAVLTIFIWPYWQAHKLSSSMLEYVPNLMIENLNLTGIDAKNQPYRVQAKQALQSQKNKDIIELVQPTGTIDMEGGSQVTGRADKGRIDDAQKTLWLGGDVTLTHDEGYTFTSPEATIDLERNTAWGDQPVDIEGDFGSAHGAGFTLQNGGETISLTGPATAHIRTDTGLHPDAKTDKPDK